MRAGIDLVCVNYQTPQDLNKFLDSVFTYPPSCEFHVWVMNVSPQRLDVEVANRWRDLHSSVTITEFEENVGYATACNAGGSFGDFYTVAFFNADVRLTKGALDGCREFLITNPEIGALGPRQVNSDNRFTHSGIVGTQKSSKFRGWKKKDEGQFSDILDVPTVSGSAYFIPRSIWDEMTSCPFFQDIAPAAEGAFLPTRHYFEERYLSAHIDNHGYRIVYFGPVKIYHEWHRASRIGGWAERQMPVSREYYRRACKHHGIEHE